MYCVLCTCRKPPVPPPGLAVVQLWRPADWAVKPSAAGDSNAHKVSAAQASLPWLHGPRVGTILSWKPVKKTNTSYVIKSCTHNQAGSLIKAVSLPVNKQVLGQPFCTDDFKNDLVSLQSLEVYSARQSWVQALGKPLPYDQPLGQEGVAEVTLQGLRERHSRKVKTGLAINQKKCTY